MLDERLIEANSWWFVGKLQSLSGGAFTVREEHACNYDTLSLYIGQDIQQPVMSLNRPGRLHIWTTMAGKTVRPGNGEDHLIIDIWEETRNKEDLKRILRKTAAAIGLDIPRSIPPYNSTMLVHKTISHYLDKPLFEDDRYTCRSGYCDCAMVRDEVRKHFFELFPKARLKLKAQLFLGVYPHPADDFWFLIKDYVPQLCLERDGTVHTRKGETFDLEMTYKQNGMNSNIAVVIALSEIEWMP